MARLTPENKRGIRRRFERAAATYDANSPVQRALAERLATHLEGEATSILELGCGTGTLTSLLRARYPEAEIVAIDFAPAMVARARERVPSATFLDCDIEELTFEPGRYDLVVSNATVQWLSDPARTFEQIAASLRPDGRLTLSTFGPRTFWELDSVLAELGRERGLQLLGTQEWETLLVGAGLHRIRAATDEERFSYPDSASFFRSVKASGAGYAPNVLPPGVLRELMERYDERFGDGVSVSATYELVIIDAARPT